MEKNTDLRIWWGLISHDILRKWANLVDFRIEDGFKIYQDCLRGVYGKEQQDEIIQKGDSQEHYALKQIFERIKADENDIPGLDDFHEFVALLKTEFYNFLYSRNDELKKAFDDMDDRERKDILEEVEKINNYIRENLSKYKS